MCLRNLGSSAQNAAQDLARGFILLWNEVVEWSCGKASVGGHVYAKCGLKTSGKVRVLEGMVLGLWLALSWPIASVYSLAKAHSHGSIEVELARAWCHLVLARTMFLGGSREIGEEKSYQFGCCS